MASEELAPGPRVTDRALFHLISAWRSQATILMREGDEDQVGPQYREGLVFLHAASMLEQTAGFCAVCCGRGEVRTEPFEDEPGGWFECSMCKGTGLSPWSRQCSVCGDVEREPHVEEVAPGVWLDSKCQTMARTADRLGMEPFDYVWQAPLGRRP